MSNKKRTYKSKMNLIRAMALIVGKTVKHYKTDFWNYDMPAIMKAQPGEARIWILRETGTYFQPDPDGAEMVCSVLDNMPNVCAYRVTIGTDCYSLERLDLAQLSMDYHRIAAEQRQREEAAAA